jgi:hypothetical protein
MVQGSAVSGPNSQLPRSRFPMSMSMGRYGEPALTLAGAADEPAHQSRPELDCRVGKLTLSNSLQRIPAPNASATLYTRLRGHVRIYRSRKPGLPAAKTRVPNAAWKCEIVQKSMGGKRCSRSSWPIAKRIGPWHGPWSCACSCAVCNRFATPTRTRSHSPVDTRSQV